MAGVIIFTALALVFLGLAVAIPTPWWAYMVFIISLFLAFRWIWPPRPPLGTYLDDDYYKLFPGNKLKRKPENDQDASNSGDPPVSGE